MVSLVTISEIVKAPNAGTPSKKRTRITPPSPGTPDYDFCGNVCTSTRQHARFCEVSPSLLFSSSRFLRLSILGQRPMGVQSMLLPFLFSGSFTILLFRRNIVKTAKALAASGGNSGGNSAAAWVLFWWCCVLGYTWLCRFSPHSAKALVKVEPSTYAAFTSHKFSAYRHSWIVYSSPVPSSGDSPEFSE